MPSFAGIHAGERPLSQQPHSTTSTGSTPATTSRPPLRRQPPRSNAASQRPATYIDAGSPVFPDGVLIASEQGVPQGGPLSPLLSNIVLDELDQELSRRGHRFARYADDAKVYVRSERAGQRVMASLTESKAACG